MKMPSRWSPGDSLSADHFNEDVDAIRDLALSMRNNSSRQGTLRCRLAVIASTGPKGSESDFTNHRYWVTLSDADNGAESDSPVAVEAKEIEGGDDPAPITFVATNLSELLGQSHSLPVGSPVWIYPIMGTSTKDSEEPTLRWVFCSAKHTSLVKATGSAAGGGKYTGTTWGAPTADIPAAGNLSEAELGLAGSTVRLVNVREVGKSTHDLASSGFLPLIFIGTFLKVAADGVPVYAIDGDQWEDCS